MARHSAAACNAASKSGLALVPCAVEAVSSMRAPEPHTAKNHLPSVSVHKRADPRCIRKHLLEQLEPFPGQLTGESGDAGDIATGPRQAVDETGRDRILVVTITMGIVLVACLAARMLVSAEHHEVDFQLQEFGYRWWHPLCFSPPERNSRNIFAFDITRSRNPLRKPSS